MLSYMILFYCRTWCQTAKRITRAIKSIPTLFTGLWNVILPLFPLPLFFSLNLMKTYGSWRSVVKMRLFVSLSLFCGRSSLSFIYLFIFSVVHLFHSPALSTLSIGSWSLRKREAKRQCSRHWLSLCPRGDTHLITPLKACWVIETERNGQWSSMSASQWAFITQNKSKGPC